MRPTRYRGIHIARAALAVGLLIMGLTMVVVVAYVFGQEYYGPDTTGLVLLVEFLLAAIAALLVVVLGAVCATLIHRSFDGQTEVDTTRAYGDVFGRYVIQAGAFIAPIATSFGVIRVVERLGS